MKKKIITCIGTRPNIIKITRLEECLSKFSGIQHLMLHTGQHHDYKMSEVFFEQFGLKKPDFFLNVQAKSQIDLIAEIMVKFEKIINEEKPDMVMVPGDVNSSMACAVVAARHDIPVAHIESGLRSNDFKMPEEQNRIIIDSVSEIFFITEQSGMNHLLNEGKPKEKLFFVGNTMIDTLVKFKQQIDSCSLPANLAAKKYLLVTFHRPSNVDDENQLKIIVSLLINLAKSTKIVFPVHPRTMKNLNSTGLIKQLENNQNIIFTEPLGYFDFIKLVNSSIAVITDSGGVQEETTFLQVPCITVRPSTERPVTVDIGTNTLASLNEPEILSYIDDIIQHKYKEGIVPPLWDGHATERIADIISKYLSNK